MRKPYSVVKEPEAQKNSVSLQRGEAARLVEKNVNRRERQERREEVTSCRKRSKRI